MANQQANDLGKRIREILREIERLFIPQQPKRALVPVPIRVPRPQQRRPRG